MATWILTLTTNPGTTTMSYSWSGGNVVDNKPQATLGDPLYVQFVAPASWSSASLNLSWVPTTGTRPAVVSWPGTAMGPNQPGTTFEWQTVLVQEASPYQFRVQVTFVDSAGAPSSYTVDPEMFVGTGNI